MNTDRYWPWSPSTTKNLRVIEAVTRARLWGSPPEDYLLHLPGQGAYEDREELPEPPEPEPPAAPAPPKTVPA